MTLQTTFEQAQATTGRLVVRMAGDADQQAVVRFYRANQHKHVDQRKAELWEERARSGKIMVIESEAGDIGFSSVAYDFEHEGAVRWMEIGSTMALQDPAQKPYEMIKGINLYPFVIASQVLHEFLSRAPEDKVVACIFEDNHAVINLLNNKVGWRFFDPDEAILKATDTTKDGKNAYSNVVGDVWLEASTPTLPHQARLVLDVMNEGASAGLQNKKSGTRVGLDLSRFSLANEFRAAVETLAHGPFADYLEKHPHIPMKDARAQLEKHMASQVQSAPKPQQP